LPIGCAVGSAPTPQLVESCADLEVRLPSGWHGYPKSYTLSRVTDVEYPGWSGREAPSQRSRARRPGAALGEAHAPVRDLQHAAGAAQGREHKDQLRFAVRRGRVAGEAGPD